MALSHTEVGAILERQRLRQRIPLTRYEKRLLEFVGLKVGGVYPAELWAEFSRKSPLATRRGFERAVKTLGLEAVVEVYPSDGQTALIRTKLPPYSP